MSRGRGGLVVGTLVAAVLLEVVRNGGFDLLRIVWTSAVLLVLALIFDGIIGSDDD